MYLIPIWLEDGEGLDRVNEPVRIGIPFARGLLADPSTIELVSDSGYSIPVSGRALCLWPDSSIKWLLVDFFANVGPRERVAYTLSGRNGSSVADNNKLAKIAIVQSSGNIAVNTGRAEFAIPTQTFAPFSCVRLNSADMLARQGSQTLLSTSDGVEYLPAIERWTIEEESPLRATLLAEGRFIAQKSKSMALFKARLVFFADLSLVRVEFQIRNPRAALHPGGLWDLGDPGSVFFNDLSLYLYPADGLDQLTWYAAEQAKENHSCAAAVESWFLYQDSSGGENWSSSNHLDCSGDVSVSFRGYRVQKGKHDDGRNNECELIAEGMRASPGVRLSMASGWLAATVEDFWQNFPKALRWENGRLSVELFPGESRHDYELQGGEQKRHVVFLDFGLPDQPIALPMLQHPLHAWVDPNWVEKTGAVSYFTPQKDDPNKTYLQYINNIIDGPHAFVNKRETIDEYGWRNFGDLYADHEAVKHQGPQALVAHYNNQYDFIYGALVHFLRSGDRRWYQLMDEAAKHVIDIDIYHTDEDRSAFNHGLFWHTEHYQDAVSCTHRTYSRKNANDASSGGGPSNEHIYTSGLLHYYYLTGDREAADTVMALADWVITLDDGSRNVLGLFDAGPTGLVSHTVDELYHKPGRGVGNAINTLIDGYALSNTRQYFEKAETLIKRCIHPKDDIAELGLNEPEHRWSYLAFLQILGKYLDIKMSLGELDYYFYYARDSLLHYADWMMKNEKPYKELLHKVEIPTETWPAQDIRKCHVFHLAAKYGPADKRPVFDEKANFFFDRCLSDLLSFKTAFLTRPLVILSVYGYVHSYFQVNHRIDFVSHGYDFANPHTFLPQKARYRATFTKKLQIAASDIKRLFKVKRYEWKRRFLKKG